MTSAEMNKRMLQAAGAIAHAEGEYKRAITKAANTERAYKRREAIALVQVASYKNADDRRAQAELLQFEDGANLGDLRYEAHLAHGMMDAAKLAVRNRNQELSALQSEASLAKAEAEFIRTSPEMVQT